VIYQKRISFKNGWAITLTEYGSGRVSLKLDSFFVKTNLPQNWILV